MYYGVLGNGVLLSRCIQHCQADARWWVAVTSGPCHLLVDQAGLQCAYAQHTLTLDDFVDCVLLLVALTPGGCLMCSFFALLHLVARPNWLVKTCTFS